MPRAAPRRARRPQRHPAWRWLQLAVVAWLTLVLAGREHVLPAIGVEVACVHPGESTARHTDPGHDARADHPDVPAADADGTDAGDAHRDAADAEGGDDCPAGCTGCACGAAPFAVASPLTFVVRTWRASPRASSITAQVGPARAATTLERPPRRA